MDEINVMFARREREKLHREKVAARKALAHRKVRKAFWATVRTGALEIGSCVTLIVLMVICTRQGLIAPALSVPAALAAMIVGTWRACQYWQVLNR